MSKETLPWALAALLIKTSNKSSLKINTQTKYIDLTAFSSKT
jgi:hypothetical protein